MIMKECNLDTIKCFICGNKNAENITPADFDGHKYRCDYCGEYSISRSAMTMIECNNNIKKEFVTKAPSLVFERNINGLTPFTIYSEGDIIKVDGADFLSQYPTDFEDKVNRSLLMLYKKNPYEKLILDDSSIYYLFAKYDNDYSINATLKAMAEMGLINIIREAALGTEIELNLAGWKYAKELSKQLERKNTCFIAMWFNDSTNLYRDATKEAIELAGYQPVIVDETNHNDFIMNKVLNSIKEAHFVIADFTSEPEELDKNNQHVKGVRGGVYYEAGYAQGLGLEVIHTCNENAFNDQRLHFDIQQKNTIRWYEEAGKLKTKPLDFDYIQYLKEHIIATVGKGSNFKETLN